MNKKLILGVGNGGLSEREEIERIARAGWDGVFTGWRESSDLVALSEQIRRLGLKYQSVHAPFGHVDTLWLPGEAGDKETETLIRCLQESASAGVHLVVMHTMIGMQCDFAESERNGYVPLGIERFGRIFDKAKEYGVRVALENVEGELYLDTLLRTFSGEKHIGFCIDTGHQMCYNHGRDWLGEYGDRLFCTHLNDNQGQTGSEITWLDDAHLLPFDGIADWNTIATQLKNIGYTGDLTFEVIKTCKPDRTANAIYDDLDYDGYIRLALQKAIRFASLVGC